MKKTISIPVLTDAPERFSETARDDIALILTTEPGAFVERARQTMASILVVDSPTVPPDVVRDLGQLSDVVWTGRYPVPDALAACVLPLPDGCDLLAQLAWLCQVQNRATLQRLTWLHIPGFAWNGEDRALFNVAARNELLPLGDDALSREVLEQLLRSAGDTTDIRLPSGRAQRVRVDRYPAQLDGRRAVLALVRPATDAAALQSDLQAIEARYRNIVEHSLQGIFVVQDMRIVFANPALARISGRTVEELLALPPDRVRDMIHPDDQPWVWRRLENRLKGRPEPPHYRCRAIRADGATRWIDLYADRILFDGRPAVQGAVLDITDEQQLRLQLTARERLSSLGTLAASVAHEINNPLSWIRNNLSSIRTELADLATAGSGEMIELPRELLRELLELADDAEQGAAQIRDITRALSTFAKTDDERESAVDVGAAIRFAATVARNELRHRAHLNLEFAPIPPIRGRQGALTQVVLNLLLNAAEAIEPGHVDDNRISISARLRGERVQIVVRDTGCGIPADDLPKIFDPFFSTRKKQDGSGLGLSITRQLLEDWNGAITVRSRVGEGTEVIVELPAVPARSKEPEPAAQVAEPDHGGALLLIEDQPEVRRSLCTVLAPHFDVTAVADPIEARAAIRELGPFEIIVSDVMLASGSGLEIVNWLRDHDPQQARRIVLLTGGVFDPATRARALASGLPILEKGDAPERLVRQLLELIRSWR